MIHISYFSATGNTKYLAEKLKDLLSLRNDQISPYGRPIPQACSHWILMFPIHGFNPARPIQKDFKTLSSRFEKVSLIAVGCNTAWVNDGVTLPLKKHLTNQLCVDAVVPMPLSFVMAFPSTVGRKTIQQAEEILLDIKRQIETETYVKRTIPFKSRAIRTIGSLESKAARLFGLELHANKSCTSCGLCWTSCPFENISENNKKPVFGFKCGLCMKCIYDCPEKAISPYISKFIPIKGGYHLTDYLEEN